MGGLVPVGAGLAGVVLGPAMVGAQAATDLDSHFRYLSGLLLGIGIGFWSTVPRIEAAGGRFRLLTAIVVAGGIGRAVSFASVGRPGGGMLFGLLMELVITPALAWWQYRVTCSRG